MAWLGIVEKRGGAEHDLVLVGNHRVRESCDGQLCGLDVVSAGFLETVVLGRSISGKLKSLGVPRQTAREGRWWVAAEAQ